MSEKTSVGRNPGKDPIAIVGIGCRFPGGVGDVRSFWQLLMDEVDAIGEMPPGRFDADAYYDPEPAAPGKIVTREGGFLDDIDQFDPFFFGVSPREATYMDPQQRLLLEVAWEALEDGGQVPDHLAGGKTGVFVGMWTGDYEIGAFRETEDINLYVTTGGGRYAAAGRLSYVFDLRGPSLTLDTACSSSLVAVHLACQSMWQGEADTALAAAVNLIIEPSITIGYSRSHMLSPDARCKFGDAAADGYVRSEGAAALFLKPLSAALAAGDPVYALIRGTAVNNDGRSSGALVAPGRETQMAVFEEAYRVAGLSPGQLGYVEAHGTGTKVGDPVELSALGAVLAKHGVQRRPIGSIKTNIGHTEAASGMAGLIKAALSLKHRRIPANLHLKTPNPNVPWDDLPIDIPQTARPWPADNKPGLAGVNSFGVTGANAHIVLQEMIWPAEAEAPALAGSEEVDRPYLFPLSAHTAAALQQRAGDLAEFLDTEAGKQVDLADLAYTTAVRRAHHPFRLALTAADRADLVARLNKVVAETSPPAVGDGDESGKIAFIFPGQGSQWPGMGRDLMEQEPVFRRALARCEAAMAPFVDWSLQAQLRSDPEDAAYRLDQIDVIQPTLLAVEIALAELWRAWGVAPDAVLGHSMGEIGAAYVAGAISLDDAMRIICRRSQLMRRTSGQGAMALVELTVSQAETALRDYEDKLSVAVSNSPRSTVIAGDPAALDELLAILEADDVFCRKVKVDVASHSPQMEPLQPELRDFLEGMAAQAGSIPIYTTSAARVSDGSDLDAAFWADNLRRPVQFSQMVERLLADGFTDFIELSPHPILLTAVQQVCHHANREAETIASLRRREPARPLLLGSVGILYTRGYTINWEALAPAGRVVTLPTYPWQKERYWLETKRRRRAGGKPSGHPLLGNRLSAPLPTFEATLDATQLPDGTLHYLGTTPLLPAAAYLDGLLALGTAVTQNHHLLLEEVTLQNPMLLAEPQVVQWLLSGDAVQVFSLQDDDNWRLHAAASLQAEKATSEMTDLDILRARLPSRPPVDYVQTLQEHTLTFGDGETAVAEPSAVWQGDGEALAPCPPDLTRREAIDGAVQLLLATAANGKHASPIADYLLVAAGRVVAHGPFRAPAWRQITVAPGEDDTLTGAIKLLDEAGRPILEATDLEFKLISRAELAPPAIDDWFYEVDWEPAPAPGAPLRSTPVADHPWLILGDNGGVGDRLVDLLQANGRTATLVKTPDALDGVDKREWRGVVYLGGLEATATTATGVYASILPLLEQTEAPLWLITRQAKSVRGEEDIHPFAAPLWGLGRTLALEQPDRWGGLLDLENGDPEDQARHIFWEITAGDQEDEVAYRAGERYVARLQSLSPPPEKETPITGDGCYLITGGLGSLGLHVARWLIRQGAGHLVLTGRSGLPPRSEWETLDVASRDGRRAAAVAELEAEGAAVTVVRADVADETAMGDLFARFDDTLPPLRGVVHAAGVTTLLPLAEMDAAALDYVLASKVEGTWLLHKMTRELALDFFVLFSSSAAVLGAVEMGHYAAANSFLDALAQYRRRRGLPALSVEWGWWAGEGITTVELADRFTQIGQNAMPPAGTLAALARLLSGDATQIMVAAINWERFKPVYEAKRDRPLISRMKGDGETAVVDDRDLIAELANTPPPARYERLRRRVRAMAGRVMGYADADTLDSSAGFFAIGMDSLMAVQLRTQLEQSLGQSLPSTVAFEYPTVDKLTDYLFSDVLQLETGAESGSPSQTGAAEVTADAVLPDELTDEDLLSMFDDELAAIDDLIDSP